MSVLVDNQFFIRKILPINIQQHQIFVLSAGLISQIFEKESGITLKRKTKIRLENCHFILL